MTGVVAVVRQKGRLFFNCGEACVMGSWAEKGGSLSGRLFAGYGLCDIADQLESFV